MNDRIPPHSEDTEQAVLGAMLIQQSAIADVAEILRSRDSFYNPSHQRIFDAIISLFQQGLPVDITTVAEEMEKAGTLETSGGRRYLAELASGVATVANVVCHANIIREKAQLRQVIDTGMAMVDDCYAQRDDTPAILERAEERIFGLVRDEVKTEFRSYGDMSVEIIEQYMSRRENKGCLPGLATGYHDLDRLLNGLKPGSLYVIAGRPSMGKTCLCQNILDNVCGNDPDATALFFSVEMPSLEVGKRSFYAMAGVSYADAERGDLTDAEADEVSRIIDRFARTRVYVDDPSTLTPLELRAKVRRFALQYPMKVMAVDYIQLMTAQGENQNLRIAEISRHLKALAKEFHIPVLSVSQLSRGTERRDDKRPCLGDLRDSGAIEQDADAVIFIYREDLYLRHLPPHHEKRAETRGKAEIIVSKNRNGPTGNIEMRFDETVMRFENSGQNKGKTLCGKQSHVYATT